MNSRGAPGALECKCRGQGLRSTVSVHNRDGGKCLPENSMILILLSIFIHTDWSLKEKIHFNSRN